MKVIAVIPARGGSKGITGKNIREMAGKPLIAWTIEQALKCQEIDRVIVTTDDKHIAEIALRFGAEVPFTRPAELASDTAATEPAVLHTLDWLREHEGYVPDLVVLLQCTSPIRHSDSISRAINELMTKGYDSSVSVSPCVNFLWKDPKSPVASYDFRNRPRRQDISENEILYKENGSIYVTREHVYRSSKNRLGGKIGLFIMSEEEGFEIDTPLDWLICETLLIKLKSDIKNDHHEKNI